jgi:hypothetical protein
VPEPGLRIHGDGEHLLHDGLHLLNGVRLAEPLPHRLLGAAPLCQHQLRVVHLHLAGLHQHPELAHNARNRLLAFGEAEAGLQQVPHLLRHQLVLVVLLHVVLDAGLEKTRVFLVFCFFCFFLYFCPEERIFGVFSVSRILLGASRL